MTTDSLLIIIACLIAGLLAILLFVLLLAAIAIIEQQATIRKAIRREQAKRDHPAYGKLRAVKREE